MLKIKLPFQDMTAENWQNLAIGALITFYIIQIVLDILWGNIFGNLGIDFASFWSAGYIANHYGYVKVYDLGLMEQIQNPLLPKTADAAFVFHAIPTPYLSIFLLPFQLISFIEPVAASWLWMLLNCFTLVVYLRYFVLKTTGQPPKARFLTMIMVASAVFLNLFIGQVNVWLTICVGEYMRAAMSGKSFQSGLWLGGLLLKPQSLILLVPALLLQRSTKTAAGLAASSTAIVGASLILGGTGSLYQLAKMWLGYAAGLPTNDPQLMMNWRMIGVHLSALTTPQLGLTVAISGLVVTFFATLYLWRRPVTPDSPLFAIFLTGTLAATGAVAWHSHVHMAMIMIPPLMYLHLKHTDLFRNKLEWWIFLPVGLYFVRLALAATMRAGFLPASINDFLDFLGGIGLFGLNLYFLGWAINQSRQLSTPPRATRAAYR